MTAMKFVINEYFNLFFPVYLHFPYKEFETKRCHMHQINIYLDVGTLYLVLVYLFDLLIFLLISTTLPSIFTKFVSTGFSANSTFSSSPSFV